MASALAPNKHLAGLEEPTRDVGRSLHHVGVNHLAFSGSLTLQQRGHDAHGTHEAAAGKVRQQIDRSVRRLIFSSKSVIILKAFFENLIW